uniref:7TM_GPCR_Srx domain-containing protein n=1 Tax=Rhabditophanes sp. KR3021 TaxID=114890 RepID=A0AC35TQ31_9BILA
MILDNIVPIFIILIGSVGLILHTICICCLLKFKTFANCFGYICLCLSITKATIICILCFHDLYNFETDITSAFEITLLKRMVGCIVIYLWSFISLGHLFITINRLIAAFFVALYYNKFNKKVSLMYTLSIFLITTIICIPLLDNDCKFYYNPIFKIFVYLNTPCTFYLDNILTKYMNMVFLKVSHGKIFTNNSMSTTNKKILSKERIFAFQCFFGTVSLATMNIVFGFMEQTTAFSHYSSSITVATLTYLTSDAVILILCNSEIRKIFTTNIYNKIKTIVCTGQH